METNGATKSFINDDKYFRKSRWKFSNYEASKYSKMMGLFVVYPYEYSPISVPMYPSHMQRWEHSTTAQSIYTAP